MTEGRCKISSTIKKTGFGKLSSVETNQISKSGQTWLQCGIICLHLSQMVFPLNRPKTMLPLPQVSALTSLISSFLSPGAALGTASLKILQHIIQIIPLSIHHCEKSYKCCKIVQEFIQSPLISMGTVLLWRSPNQIIYIIEMVCFSFFPNSAFL